MHVPDEHLARYRRLAALARHLERIGNTRSNHRDYDGANAAWRRSAYVRALAFELRVPPGPVAR